MALTPSTMLPIGTTAPDFNLPEPRTGQNVSLCDLAGFKALVVVFFCNHCPYVIHLKTHFSAFARKYQQAGVSFVAINSNDIETYFADSPQKMIVDAETYNYPFPYLLDETQTVAKAYQAACTPDFYLFDQDHKLVYRGQYDDSRPGNNKPVTGADLEAAVEFVLRNEAIEAIQVPSMGCNIKWIPGNSPAYFS